jgi:hypothetical protein
MATKTARKTGRKGKAAKRELLHTGSDKRYVRRCRAAFPAARPQRTAASIATASTAGDQRQHPGDGSFQARHLVTTAATNERRAAGCA